METLKPSIHLLTGELDRGEAGGKTWSKTGSETRGETGGETGVRQIILGFRVPTTCAKKNFKCICKLDQKDRGMRQGARQGVRQGVRQGRNKLY